MEFYEIVNNLRQDLFKFGGNKDFKAKKGPKKDSKRESKKEIKKKTEKPKPSPPQPKSPSPQPQKESKPTPKPKPKLSPPPPEEEEEVENMFGTQDTLNDDQNQNNAFLESAPIKAKEADPFSQGEPDTKQESGLGGVYIPKEAMEARNQIKTQPLDKDLMTVETDGDLDNFDSDKKQTNIDIAPLPKDLETVDKNPNTNEGIDDELFDMLDGGDKGGGEGVGEGGLDISKYIAQNNKGDDMSSLFS
ncbi:hypothetical protein AAMO2058_000475900 [Amorphochlora amoebiformis]